MGKDFGQELSEAAQVGFDVFERPLREISQPVSRFQQAVAPDFMPFVRRRLPSLDALEQGDFGEVERAADAVLGEARQHELEVGEVGPVVGQRYGWLESKPRTAWLAGHAQLL